jgi:hypothetical protein
MADIREAKSSEDCICDGVRQYVCIGVALKALRMRDSNAPENQRPILSKLMNVISNANTIHDFESLGRVKK